MESLDVTVVSFLLQNIAKLRATASMAMDDQGIVLNGTANIVSALSSKVRFLPCCAQHSLDGPIERSQAL